MWGQSSCRPLLRQLFAKYPNHFLQFFHLRLRFLFTDAADVVGVGAVDGPHGDRFGLAAQQLAVAVGDLRHHPRERRFVFLDPFFLPSLQGFIPERVFSPAVNGSRMDLALLGELIPAVSFSAEIDAS